MRLSDWLESVLQLDSLQISVEKFRVLENDDSG